MQTFENFYDGKLIDSETYIGGHVEALQTGIYWADFTYDFKIDKEAY